MFKKNLINNLFITLLLAIAIGFFVSRAVVSIATVVIFILAVYYRAKHKIKFHADNDYKTLILFAAFYFLILFCSFLNGQPQCLIQPLASFAPMLLLPFAFYTFKAELWYIKKWINVVNWIFIGGALFLLLDMVYRQGLNSSKIIALAEDSKNVSNILDVHHNVVGFLAVYSVIYIAELLKRNRKPLLLVLLLLIITLIHYLGLRFAILAFYPLLLIYLLRLNIKPVFKTYSLLVGVVLLVGSFIFIPAFKGRYQNTKADVENILSNRNPNFWSINQRLIANEIGIDIAKKKLFFGVGTCNIKQAVDTEYLKNSRLLIPENRKFIHNQLIYGWATFGSLYFIGWFSLFGFLIYRGIRERSILLEITLLFILHQMMENSLEKQLMLVLLIYFSCLMPKGIGGKFKVKSLK